MKYAAATLLALIGLAINAQAETESRNLLTANFERQVLELAESVDGVLGVSIQSLVSDAAYTVNGDVVFTQASSIKLPLLFEFYRQVDAGQWRLDEPVALQSSDIVAGSGVLQTLSAGAVTMPLQDYVTLMITVSDNTATNMLIDRVKMQNVNTTMRRLGLPDTRLQRKMMDREAWLADSENLSTPNEQARLLELIYRRESLSDESTDNLLEVLSIPKSSRIRPLLPDDVRVAHKTGSVPGVVADVGIVFLEDHPFIISAMVNWVKDPVQAELAISQIALLAYDYFDQLAHSNRFGHKE